MDTPTEDAQKTSQQPVEAPKTSLLQPIQKVVEKIPIPKDQKKKEMLTLIVVGALVVSAGVGTGWLLSGSRSSQVLGNNSKTAPGAKLTEKEAGIADEETFRDTAEGTIESGGIDGEGTHHLVREGGEDQYVYLTSTVIDLESFAGKKVQIWGETTSAQKAGWLMDVGKVKVLD